MKKIIEYGIASSPTGKVFSKTFKFRREAEEFRMKRSNPEHWEIVCREIEYGDWKNVSVRPKLEVGDMVRVINQHSSYHPYGTIGTVYSILECVDMSSLSNYSVFTYDVKANDVILAYEEDDIEFLHRDVKEDENGC